jgi:nitrogen fixation protein NifU and related proteins
VSELTDLYQELILDHNRRPRNYGALAGATHSAQGYNPLCGDKLKLYLKVDHDRIAGVSFEGSGCAISKASASLMTEAIAGRSLDDVDGIFERFHAMITAPTDKELSDAEREAAGKLAVFSGVREFPMRVKCASLAWHTLKAALAGKAEPVKTE